MAYDINFPSDDSYLSDFPAGDREQNRALKDDQIVNAGRLRGLTVGNENGQIPINNGTENTNLNAALLNGKASSYFATSNHTHTTATQSSNGYMSNADKKKLDGIASGAEVNQNAFANVKVGSTTIQSDAKQDTLELAAGTNISLVGDANNDKVTIGVTGTVAKATQDSAGQTINTTYVKGVTASNSTITVTKGNGTTSTATINNVAHSTSADSATEAGNINKGFQVNQEDFHISDFRQTILGRANYGICARPFCGKLPNNTSVSSPGIAFGGIDTHGFIQMEYGTSNIYVGAGNANKINWYKKLAITDSPAFSGTPTAPTPGVDTNNTQLATCGFVRNAIAKYAPMLDTMKKVYPVGSIYMSTVSTNPATLFGFGTWEAMPAGRVLLAQGKSSWGTTYNAGSTGGEATHTLTVGELPAHTHTGSTSTTGNHTHNVTIFEYFEGGNGWGLGTYKNGKYWQGARFQGGCNVQKNTTNWVQQTGNHSHTLTIGNTGNGQAFNVTQPYLAVYIWKRTA